MSDDRRERGDGVTIKDIVREYLETHGYAGLAGDECGCGLDDLWPCDGPGFYCRPAYRWTCPAKEADCPGSVPDWGCDFYADAEGCYRTEKQP